MTVTVTYHLSDLILELNRLFNIFNSKFFNDKLEQPVIVVQSSRKKRTLGTCSVNRIWIQKASEDTNAKYEISISAEYLNRPIEDICATLIHEMVHLHCGLNNIKDTSNNYVYHNKKFKEQAEARGLIIEHAKTIGWSVTTLKPETREYIQTLNVNQQPFEYYRRGAIGIPVKITETLTKSEKLNRLYIRMEKIRAKIQKLEAEKDG